MNCRLCYLLSRRTVEVVLDGPKKRKRGKAVQAVRWTKDSIANTSVRGHQYVTAVLSLRGCTIPSGIRLYLKKELCRVLQPPFGKITELAAELISAFQPPQFSSGSQVVKELQPLFVAA